MEPNHKIPIFTIFIRHNNILLPIKLKFKSTLLLYKNMWKCRINSLCYHSNTNLAPFIDFWRDLCIILLGGIHYDRETIYNDDFSQSHFCWFYFAETFTPVNNWQFLIRSLHKLSCQRAPFLSVGLNFGRIFGLGQIFPFHSYFSHYLETSLVKPILSQYETEIYSL